MTAHKTPWKVEGDRITDVNGMTVAFLPSGVHEIVSWVNTISLNFDVVKHNYEVVTKEQNDAYDALRNHKGPRLVSEHGLPTKRDVYAVWKKGEDGEVVIVDMQESGALDRACCLKFWTAWLGPLPEIPPDDFEKAWRTMKETNPGDAWDYKSVKAVARQIWDAAKKG